MTAGIVYTFDLIKNTLIQTQKSLSIAQYKKAFQTIQDLEVIQKKLSEITTFDSDNDRNRFINQLTKGGAEDGFSKNIQILNQRLYIFQKTFEKSKERKDLKGFFSCFNTGDPCLSGRIESLYKYAASLDGFDIDSMIDPNTNLDLPGVIFAEIIMQKDDSLHELTFEDFFFHIKNNLDDIVTTFKNKNSEETIPFLDFLITEGIYNKTDAVNWKDLILKLLHNPKSFEKVFKKSMEFVIS